jgi:Family of unknown function (DUF6527)
MRYARLAHEFVDHIPDVLDPGVLYVSMKYATAAHRCCCGCGLEVVTPFTPTDWKLTFDGEQYRSNGFRKRASLQSGRKYMNLYHRSR